jgi:hypothetical protein
MSHLVSTWMARLRQLGEGTDGRAGRLTGQGRSVSRVPGALTGRVYWCREISRMEGNQL